MVDIESVDRDTGQVMDTAGNIGQVLHWLDDDSAVCDAAEATRAIVVIGCGYMTVNLRPFIQVSIH